MLTVWLLHLEACLWLHCLYTSESRSKGMVCYFVAMTEVTFQSSIKNENPVTKPLEELVSLSYSLLQKDDKYCTKEFWGINLTWKRSRFKPSCLIQMKIWSKILVFISSALTSCPGLCHGPKRFFPQQSSEPDKIRTCWCKSILQKWGRVVPADASYDADAVDWGSVVWTSPTPSCHFFSSFHLTNLFVPSTVARRTERGATSVLSVTGPWHLQIQPSHH